MSNKNKHPKTPNAATEQDKGRCAPAPGSATRVKMTFRIVELHTIERFVDTRELKRRHEDGDVASWLDDQFYDDPMSDSDMCTESVDIDNWETLPNDQAH